MKDKNKQRKEVIHAVFQEKKAETELLPPQDDLTPEHQETDTIRVVAYFRVASLSALQEESFEIQHRKAGGEELEG